MVLERIMQHIGIPDALLFSVRDCALYSAALDLSGYPGLEFQLDRLRAARPERMRIVSEHPTLIVDCEGEHAWIAAETLLDLAVERLRLTGEGRIVAENVVEPREAGVIRALAEKYDLDAAIAASPSGRIEIVVMPRGGRGQAVLDRIRRDGIEVSSDLWWRLFHRASEALAPDTVESRRHAGTVRVEADGRVVGRGDEDETDLTMLTDGSNQIGRRTDANPAVRGESRC